MDSKNSSTFEGLSFLYIVVLEEVLYKNHVVTCKASLAIVLGNTNYFVTRDSNMTVLDHKCSSIQATK